MASFSFTAIDKKGNQITDVINAESESKAMFELLKSYASVTSLIRAKGDSKLDKLLNFELGGNKLNRKAFTLMLSQFAITIKSGIPIGRALHLLENKTNDKTLKKLIKNVAEDVMSGRSLASSFKEHGEAFLPTTFIETVNAGEKSGKLYDSFNSMHKHFDQQNKIRSEIKSAISYPIFILIVAIVVVIVLMVKVIPVFTDIFDSYDSELPVITQILVSVSDFFSSYWWVLLIIALFFTVTLILLKRNEKGEMFLAKLKLKIPIIGNILMLSAASEFANTMATLSSSGLPISQSLNITADVISNVFVKDKIKGIVSNVESGFTLCESLRHAEIMPDILVDMIGIGETSGELDDTLNTVADYYETEVATATKSAMEKLSPIILIGVALLAGFIVIAVYVAMFDMYGVM